MTKTIYFHQLDITKFPPDFDYQVDDFHDGWHAYNEWLKQFYVDGTVEIPDDSDNVDLHEAGNQDLDLS